MKILVIGAGVIGTVYGYALAEAGNEVTHYVRPGKKAQFEQGIKIRLLDGRGKKAQEKEVFYPMRVTETITPQHDFDLILVSVRHYQIESVLPLLQENAGKANVLFFNGKWGNFDAVEKALPGKFLWGFPVAGGGYHGQELEAALLDEVRLGEIDGQPTARLEQIARLFEGAGLKVDIQKNILHWLWVHFAINCGIIAAAFKAGGAHQLLNSVSHLRLGILAGREALAVCRARGVDVESYEDARMFYSPALLGAAAVWLMMKTNLPARKIMECHTAVDELQAMISDLYSTGERLNISMPVMRSLKPYVDHPHVNHV
jgi:2-dehydropantoate 2-reductase